MDAQVTQELKDNQIGVWQCHKARQAQFSQQVRDKMKQNGGNPNMMAKLEELFNEADANQDGNLNEDEFIVFRKKLTDMQAMMNGEGVTIPEDIDRQIWQKCDKFFSDHDGFALDDIKVSLAAFRTFGMKPESKYRVWYFEGMYGRAEPIRLMLTHAGLAWEDMGVKMGDWGLVKGMVPGGSLPLIEMPNGAMKGGATRAVIRFLALTYGYYPDDPMQAQQCDMITDAFQDCFELSGDAAFGKHFDPATIPECQTKYWAKLNDFLTFLEPYCAKGQFLCGPKLCAADFWVGSMVLALIKNPMVTFGQGDDDASWNGILKKYPGFKAWSDRFLNANQTRMNTRPACPF